MHPDFVNKSKVGIYVDTKMEVDDNVGQIADALKEVGIEGNTIVILTGNNGAANYPSPELSPVKLEDPRVLGVEASALPMKVACALRP